MKTKLRNIFVILWPGLVLLIFGIKQFSIEESYRSDISVVENNILRTSAFSHEEYSLMQEIIYENFEQKYNHIPRIRLRK